MEEVDKKEPTKKNTAMGCLTLIVIIIAVVFILQGCFGDDDKQPATSVNNAAQTTQQPAVSPPPAPTQSALSQAEQEYAKILVQNTSGWGECLTTLGKLFEYPMLGSNQWTGQVAAQIVTMQQLARQAEAITPPAKFKDMHITYMKAVSEFKWVASNLPRAIDNMDVAAINECTTRLQKGNTYIDEAATQLNAINKK